jgi:hypothetical protein
MSRWGERMVTDLVELLRYHDLIAKGVEAMELVRVGRVPSWLGSSHTRLIESVPRPNGPPWRVFRSRDALHVLVPAGDQGWYVGELAPLPRPAPEPKGRLDHRLVSPRRRR